MVAVSIIQENDKFNFSIIVGRLKLEKSSATSFDEFFALIQRSRSKYGHHILSRTLFAEQLHTNWSLSAATF